MNISRGEGQVPSDKYGAGQPSGQEGRQATTGPGKHAKPPGALARLIAAVKLHEQLGVSILPVETSHPVTESHRAADTPAAEPAPATALSAADHPLPDTFDSLYQLAGMTSSAGEITISVNGKTLVDWQQLPKLLTENCHVSIALGHSEGGPDLALLKVLVALNLALQRETRAKVTLAVPDRSYWRALEQVSSEKKEPGREGLRSTALPHSDLSNFFRQARRA